LPLGGSPLLLEILAHLRECLDDCLDAMAEVRAGEIAMEQFEPFFFVKRRDSRLTAMQFVDLVQSGVTKPCLFGIESMADKIGYEAVVDSAISLFLDGMRAEK